MENKPFGRFKRWQNRIQQEVRWLRPGLGVKRWLALIIIGTILVAFGFAVLVLDLYRSAPETWWVPVLSTLSLGFLSGPMRAIIFGGSGMALILWGTWGMNRTLLRPFLHPGKPILDTVSSYRRKTRGPRIVAIGGGTGLATVLRGLKEYTNNLTAIVTVADDGGSSGELRRTIGILPPGDIRNCLTALSSDETLMTQIFKYRFASGAGLNGHTLGNLLITALTEITGSFEEAVAESGRVLAVQGQVLPSTLHDVRLSAEISLPDEGRQVIIKGESQIPKAAGEIKRVWLEPSNPLAFPPAIQAILAAEIIVVGPGSLFTSILPNLLVPDLAAALRASRALKFYVGNIAMQLGETEGFSCGDHAKTIERYTGGPIFDVLVCNSNFTLDQRDNLRFVMPEEDLNDKYAAYMADLVDVDNPWRHDSRKIAKVIMDLYYERTGPLLLKESDF